METNRLVPITYEAFIEKFRDAGYTRIASIAELVTDGGKHPFYLAELMEVFLKLWETGEVEIYEKEEEEAILDRIAFDLGTLIRESSQELTLRKIS